MLQVSTRTETFTDLSLSIASDDNIRYINTRLSCNSLVLYKDQPHAHVFVSRSWLWWIVSKIFRQVVDSVCFLRVCPGIKLRPRCGGHMWVMTRALPQSTHLKVTAAVHPRICMHVL